MITVADYDPAWPQQFEALRAEYAVAMAAAGVAVAAIEHVGSTAVPGLAAKPVIDCDIVVRAAGVPAASAVLAALGFAAEGELGIAHRWAFRAPARLPRTHTYVTVAGCLALRNHLALRDTLRADAALREEYASAKRRAASCAADISQYIQAKNAIVMRILAAAGLAEADLTAIARSQSPSPPE